MPTADNAALPSPTLLQEGPEWLVLVPAYGGAIQTYHCDSEQRARALLKLFERRGPPPGRLGVRR